MLTLALLVFNQFKLNQWVGLSHVFLPNKYHCVDSFYELANVVLK